MKMCEKTRACFQRALHLVDSDAGGAHGLREQRESHRRAAGDLEQVKRRHHCQAGNQQQLRPHDAGVQRILLAMPHEVQRAGDEHQEVLHRKDEPTQGMVNRGGIGPELAGIVKSVSRPSRLHRRNTCAALKLKIFTGGLGEPLHELVFWVGADKEVGGAYVSKPRRQGRCAQRKHAVVHDGRVVRHLGVLLV